MKYPLSEKYNTPELMGKIMGPNPMKLEEELLAGHQIPAGSVVCDLGSGQGLTSVFLAKEYGFIVYAADLWSDPEETDVSSGRWDCPKQKSFQSKRMQPRCHLKQSFLIVSSVRILTTILVVIRNSWIKNCCPFLRKEDMSISRSQA